MEVKHCYTNPKLEMDKKSTVGLQWNSQAYTKPALKYLTS